jgi:hypothetical protein
MSKSISNILKPKTKRQIEDSVCEEYGIEVSSRKEIKGVMNLLKIIDIIHTDAKDNDDHIILTSLIFQEVNNPSDVQIQTHHSFEIDGGEYNFEIESIREIRSVVCHHKIYLLHPIYNWKEIYKQVVKEMVISAGRISFKITDERDLPYRIMAAANSIAVNTRRGPGDFLIANKQTIKRIPKLPLKFIKDNTFNDKVILVGRKTQMMDRGIHLVKNKRFYNIAEIGDLNKYYICLNFFDKDDL